MALWKTDGEYGNDSGGDDTPVDVITRDGWETPDPGDAVRAATLGRHPWSRINKEAQP
jgi:hypothetical protein